MNNTICKIKVPVDKGYRCPSCDRYIVIYGWIVKTAIGETEPMCGWCADECEMCDETQ